MVERELHIVYICLFFVESLTPVELCSVKKKKFINYIYIYIYKLNV